MESQQNSQVFTVDEKLKYDGQGLEMASLILKNIFLTVLTLGIYAAWGRTNQRRYLWGVTSFLGDRATYTGQGKELFKGWMRLVLIYIILVAVVNILSSVIHTGIGVLVGPLYLYLYALVLYGGSRYRLGRTTWRGVHFGVYRDKEQTKKFIHLIFKYALLSVFSLGFGLPVLFHEVRTFLTNRSFFGTNYFTYSAKRREYCLLCYEGFFLSVLTLGLYVPWFRANLLRFRLRHTSLAGLSFQSELEGSALLRFALVSYLLSLVTLGLATPWLLNRYLGLQIGSIRITGSINFDSITNVTQSEGDATADIAAVDYDLDLGL